MSTFHTHIDMTPKSSIKSAISPVERSKQTPSRVPSRTNSQIVQAFTLARQEMELEVDKKHITKLNEQANQRRLERETKLGKVKARVSKPDVNNAISNSEKYKQMDDHRIELKQLYERLTVNPDTGLSSSEADLRNKKFGDNAISEKKKTPWYINLIKQLTTLFACLLWVGGTLSLIAYAVDTSDPSSLYLGVVLLIVNFMTGLVTYFQNAKSEAIVDAFKNFIPPKTKVLRAGNYTTIDAAKLVPGDIIELKGGDRIPADIRIIFAQEMKVDNSSLTGESDALLRTVECTNKENPLETDNLAFFGTLVNLLRTDDINIDISEISRTQCFPEKFSFLEQLIIFSEIKVNEIKNAKENKITTPPLINGAQVLKEGIGRGIVIQIGDSTVIGQIANLASSAVNEETPLRKEINRFILIVITFAFSCGILFFILGVIIGYKVITDVTFAIGILVASVPEGLLATVTAALTITAKRLATKKVLVKNLEAVETLGSTSCICSDKTGTLTQNKMTVQNLWYNDKIVRGLNYQKFGPNHAYEYDIHSSAFRALHENAIVCSEAVFDKTTPTPKEGYNENDPTDKIKKIFMEEVHERKTEKKLWLERAAIGDASETALIRFYQPIEDIGKMRSRFAVREMNDKSLAKIPFNSSWKYALTVTDYKTENSDNCIFIKGAPEKIWQLSTHVLVNDQPVPITTEWRKKFEQVNRTFGEGGERVLGFAKLHLPRDKYPHDFQFNCKNVNNLNFPLAGFVFTGLVSLVDPPREVVPFSILKCKTAGIKVIMVTGDQPVTAAAIARQVNIFDQDEKTVNQIAEEKGIPLNEAFGESDAIVIHGDLITQATQADELLPESERGKTIATWLQKPRIVFARTTPAQKLIIVKACQDQGHIVAVTGDGVNDSPAIKKADIGIAMGITGSDVAKDAADMILLTDDFSAIITGIEEGRKIFDNLKKSIIYCTSINIPQLIPFLTFIILGFPLPLTPILMLAIDLGTDVIPAIAFASEESELGIMLRPPRRKTEHMVTSKLLTSAYGVAGVFECAGGFLCYFTVMRDFGFPLQELFGLMKLKGFFPNDGDVFDPVAPYNGNTSELFEKYCNACWNDASKCDIKDLSDNQISDTPDWIHNDDKSLDLRLYYLRCANENGIKSIYSALDFGECRVKQISSYSGVPVCNTTESLKFAQTSYFIAIVIAQISNAMSIKSRKFSFVFTGLTNFSLIFGFASEASLTLILSYANPFHYAFNTREVTFLHYGIPAIPFSVIALLYNEVRKFLIRNARVADYRKGNWFERNAYW